MGAKWSVGHAEEEGEVVTGLTLEGRVEEAVVREEERRVEMVAECGEGKEEEKGEEGGVEREEKTEEGEEEEEEVVGVEGGREEGEEEKVG